MGMPNELLRLILEEVVGEIRVGVKIRIYGGTVINEILSQDGQIRGPQYNASKHDFKFPVEMGTPMFLVNKFFHGECISILTHGCAHFDTHILNAPTMLQSLKLPQISPARVTLDVILTPKDAFSITLDHMANTALRYRTRGAQWAGIAVFAEYATHLRDLQITLWRGNVEDMAYQGGLEQTLACLGGVDWEGSPMRQREVNAELINALQATVDYSNIYGGYLGHAAKFQTSVYLPRMWCRLLEDHLEDLRTGDAGQYLYNLEKCMQRTSVGNGEEDKEGMLKEWRAETSYRDFGERVCVHQKLWDAEYNSGK